MLPMIILMVTDKRRKPIKASTRAGSERRTAPAGTGTRKRKVRRKPTDDEFIKKASERSIKDDDDISEDSFMVEPKKVIRDSGKDIGKVRRVSSKPAFGESLKVGFSTRNSKRNSRREDKESKTAESDDSDADAISRSGMRDLDNIDRSDEARSEISDVDEESYIEWDGNRGKVEESSVENEINIDIEELRCRNCDGIINMKFIKNYTRMMGAEQIKVKGPFCSKLCSMEFTET